MADIEVDIDSKISLLSRFIRVLALEDASQTHKKLLEEILHTRMGLIELHDKLISLLGKAQYDALEAKAVVLLDEAEASLVKILEFMHTHQFALSDDLLKERILYVGALKQNLFNFNTIADFRKVEKAIIDFFNLDENLALKDVS